MTTLTNKYNMIVAADENWCIGKNGKLLDHFPEDIRFFKSTTTNKIVIMGRNTQESLPNKSYLKNRINIVLTKNSKWQCLVCQEDDNTYELDLPSIEQIPDFITVFQCIQNDTGKYSGYSFTNDNIFVIGGGQVYKQFLEKDMINTIYLTKIHHEYNGDTFIPNLYELGFKKSVDILPEAINENGVKYSISILTK